jgi:predicted nucleic acid-binding protein
VKVLVDTCVWSLAFKNKDSRNKKLILELETLIDENRVAIIGPIKQEILSAYKNEDKFKTIMQHLAYFPNMNLIDTDYEIAARFHNICRGKGIQGGHIDFLICSIAARTNSFIYTLDKDFSRYKKYLPIEIYKTRK